MLIEFNSERLLFRKFTIDDASLVYELNKDPEVLKYLHEPVVTIETAQNVLSNIILPQYELNNYGRWAVYLKSNLEFVGWCGLKKIPEFKFPDLGYRFMKKHWGKGYASEAARRTIEYGFMVLQLPGISATAHVDNTASSHVLEKCGMKFIEETIFNQIPVKSYEILNL